MLFHVINYTLPLYFHTEHKAVVRVALQQAWATLPLSAKEKPLAAGKDSTKEAEDLTNYGKT